MKVIDLLNKIANGEETPKKFKIGLINYDFINGNAKIDYELFVSLLEGDYGLNDEIEIIEDTPNKLEQIGKSYDIVHYSREDDTYNYDLNKLIDMVQDIYNKQSEIIDRLNGEENE